jgi:hypothetical protein
MGRTSILAIGLALCLAAPVIAGETVTEHETYEKRSMKVETMGATTTTTRPSRVERESTYEETETRRVERAPAPTVEKRTTIEVPAPIVREKTTERTEETRD